MRGIALALAAVGAPVYLTGRNVRGASTTGQPTATIDDTADMIGIRGGTAIPVRVDHTIDDQVGAFFARIQRHPGRVDLLVNNAWGGYEPPNGFWEHMPFWELLLRQWKVMHTAGLRAHMIMCRCAMPLMLTRGGLIMLTTTGIAPLGPVHSHLFYGTFKGAINRLAFGMAQECMRYGITVIPLSLGNEHLFTRTWEGDSVPANAIQATYQTFSPEYAGRAVAALVNDPHVMQQVGLAPFLEVPTLARMYGFVDIDEQQP